MDQIGLSEINSVHTVFYAIFKVVIFRAIQNIVFNPLCQRSSHGLCGEH